MPNDHVNNVTGVAPVVDIQKIEESIIPLIQFYSSFRSNNCFDFNKLSDHFRAMLSEYISKNANSPILLDGALEINHFFYNSIKIFEAYGELVNSELDKCQKISEIF